MARTRLFGPPPVDSKKAFRDVVEALEVADAAAAEDRGHGRGWRKAWSAVREFMRTDPRCIQQRRERLQAQVLGDARASGHGGGAAAARGPGQGRVRARVAARGD